VAYSSSLKPVSTCFNQYPGQETQNVYDEKRKEKTKQWEAEVKTYMELPKWKARRPAIARRSGR
jgi:hypothetical protein